MASESQPTTHPVLLAIAAASFLVLMILGIDLYTSDSSHAAATHTLSEQPKSAH